MGELTRISSSLAHLLRNHIKQATLSIVYGSNELMIDSVYVRLLMDLKSVLMSFSRLELTPPSRITRDVPLSTLLPSVATLGWWRCLFNMAAPPPLPTSMATPLYTGLPTMDMTSAWKLCLRSVFVKIVVFCKLDCCVFVLEGW